MTPRACDQRPNLRKGRAAKSWLTDTPSKNGLEGPQGFDSCKLTDQRFEALAAEGIVGTVVAP
jgi:hypothetical protein